MDSFTVTISLSSTAYLFVGSHNTRRLLQSWPPSSALVNETKPDLQVSYTRRHLRKKTTTVSAFSRISTHRASALHVNPVSGGLNRSQPYRIGVVKILYKVGEIVGQDGHLCERTIIAPFCDQMYCNLCDVL